MTRHALALLMLCGSAQAAEWNPFADEPAGFNPFTESAASCPCGDVCPCPPGECRCPNCPHRTGKAPDLTVTTADNCGPCLAYARDEEPRLLKAGWTIKTVKVPLGSEPTPRFTLKSGRELDRYPGVVEFEAWISGTTTPVVTTTKAVVAQEPARVIVNAPRRSPVIRNVPPASQRWTYSGSDLAGHLRRTHGIDPSGMSHQDMVNAHSHAHQGTWGRVSGGSSNYRVSSGYGYSSPMVRSSGCPGGNCPTSSRRSGGGIFGWGILN